MSIGDAIRGLIDPLHPAVREWLRRELPRLVAEGYIEGTKADQIAQRYGVRLDAPLASVPGAPAPHPRSDPTPADLQATAARPPADGPQTAEADDERPTPPPYATQPAVGHQPPHRTGPLPPIPGAPPPTAGPPPREMIAEGVAPAGGRAGGSPFLADHAVSIVLYLGAFLVVAAVVIFLSYSWENISGGAKLLALNGLTAGFLAAAWLCLSRPAVRPAGRTFLALGAILVPANVAAAYLVYFEDSVIPGAVFVLVGALISGGLHAALSARLQSKGYGVLAILAVPVGAEAISSLVVPKPGLAGVAAALALILTLGVARRAPPTALVQVARAVGSLLLPFAMLMSLTYANERDASRWAPVLSLPLMSLGLAWEATRGGKTWWIGAAVALLTSPLIAIGIAVNDTHPWFGIAAASVGIVAAVAARLLPKQQRALWDIAAIAPALLYPFVAWEQDAACIALFASFAVVCGIVAWGWRSTWPLYALVLGVDGAYVKLLDVFSTNTTPEWMLGLAIWPLGMAWMVLGLVLAGRRGGPGWFGSQVTILAALAIASSQPGWSAAIAASGAVACVLAAWRLRINLVLALAVPWLLVAGYQGAEALALPYEWRAVAAGATGWLLIASSLLAVAVISRAVPAAQTPATGESEPGGSTAARPLPAQVVLDLDWALVARASATAVAMFAALLMLADWRRTDPWLNATTVAWLDVTLVLAAWAALSRSRSIGILAAVSVVMPLATGIMRLHPDNAQAYALPIGLYLLVVAAVTQRLTGRWRRPAGSGIAALGMLVLMGVGIVQSFDRGQYIYALLTFGEGLALVGLGIALRWRVLVIGGVAGTVLSTLRQLFDVVTGLPGWAILGGSGMLLLGTAVALLLMRARLVAAGRSVADRWSGWD